MTSGNPDKEDDEGYLAAGDGRGVAENPYPRGTIRYAQWRDGWQAKRNELAYRHNDGYLGAVAGFALADNPHPKGTIRYEQWRLGWHIRRQEMRRALRLEGLG